jgi:type IX secretion system substrate protein
MKQYLLSIIGFFVFIHIQGVKSQTSYTWNGSSSTAWNTPANWTPNGIPGAVDNVTIVTGSNTCKLNASTAITNITMTSGTLDMGGFTLSPIGNAIFTAGTIQNGILTIGGGAANTAVLTNTTFNASATLNITTGAITVSGGTYGGAVTLNQTGATQTTGNGGAIFNSTLSITNSGTNNFRINGNCTYNGAVTLNNSGNGYLLPELTTGSTYGNTLTLNNTSATQNIRMAYLGTNKFNGNIVVNNTGGGSITFCEQASATATLANDETISIGGSGFTVGTLTLSRFTQVGSSAAQNLILTGSATMTFNNSTIFNATLTVSSPNIYTSNCTYNGATTLTKTDGTNSNNMNGGNTYNNTLTINYTAITNPTAGIYWGFAAGTPDTYNGNLFVNNSSADRILWGVGASGNNVLNGNLTVTQTGSALGIGMAWSAGTTWTQAAGKTISIGAAGFSVGYLGICGLTTSSAVNLTTTGTSAIYLGNLAGVNPCTFGSIVSITAPDIYVRGSTFNSRAYFTKTGGGSDHNNGNQNIFNASCTINQQSSAGYFMLGYNSNEQFNDSIIVTSTGTGGINLGWSSGTGTPTLAAGKSVFVGSAGFNAGYLRFGGFTQLGTVPINLTLTGTAAIYINNTSSNSTFNAVFNVTAPDITIQGGTFNSRAYFTKTGGTSDFGNGVQNIYNGSCNINQQSNGGFFLLSYNSNDQFNDSIIVTSTGTGGIGLGWNSGTGTPTLASGKSVFVGATGFSAGYLRFGTFTQLGSAPINLNFTGIAAIIYFDNHSVFGGNVTTSSPDVYFDGCTFSGTVNATKTGAGNDASSGGNTFQQASTFNNTGAGYLLLGNGTADIWNAASTFNNSGSNVTYVAYNSAGNMFNGNITVTNTGSATGIQFCAAAASTATLSAGNTIQIGAAGYNTGYLDLYRFTQLGSAAINLTFTGAATVIQVGPSSAIGGNFTVVSPRILLNGAVYSDSVNVTKNGATGEWSTGGNTFNSTLTVNQLGSGFFGFANGSPDIYNGDVYANNNSTERIIFGNNPTGNMYNGNIILTQIGSSVGIAFGWSATTNETMAAGKTISIGAAGFNVGYLQIERFTQLGNTPMNLLLTGTASLTFGPTSTIGGNVTSTSATLLFNGCTFNGTVNSTKNGATNDASAGSNIFNAAATMTNSGSGYLMFGNGNADQFNAASTFNNTGSANIYVAYNSSNNIFGGVATFSNSPTTNNGIYVSWLSTGTIFNNNIVVNSTFGTGVQFSAGNATATTTLSAGNTISVGAGGFSTGTLLLQQFTQVGSTAQTLTLTSTGVLNVGPSSAFGGNVNFLSPQLDINGCTYSGTATLQANGATNSNGNGGNIFNGVTVITNSGSGQFLTGNVNADQFNAPTTFNNTGSYRFYFAQNHGGQTTTFANTLTMNSAKTGGGDAWSFFVCEGNNTNVTFGGAVSLNCSGSIQSNCRFVNGASSTATFNGNDTINVTNSAATQIQMGTTGTSTYNGNIIVSNSGGASGIYFNVNATASSTLANGQTITTGVGGFNAGGLYLYRFTQIGGTTQSLTLTGTANLTFGPTSAFGGNVTCTSPTLLFNGCTFSGTLIATKNGVTNDGSIGNNIFNGTTTITNSGSGYLQFGNGNSDQFNSTSTFNNTGSANIYVADNSTNNIFGGVATFNNTPTANTLIYVSRLSTGTIFNNNIVVTSTFGQGVQFCQGNATATATLAAGNTINIGAGGFSVGTLLLKQFTQTGATAQSITLTGTGNLTFGPTSAFGGNVTTVSPTILFNGCTFSGTVISTKNGATNDASVGGNTFNGAFTVTNTGVGYFLMGNGSPDVWNSTATFNNLSTGQHMYTAYNSTGNQFNGNVIFNNQPTANNLWMYVNNFGINTQFNGNISVINVNGAGVYFGNNTGTATLASGNTISVGAAGFNFGSLVFVNFIQAGATAQSITTTGTSTIQYATGSIFNGSLTSVSPALLFNGATFNGTVNCTKNGASNDQSTGANTFNGSSTFTNSGTGYIRMAGTTADAYNGNVTFVQSSTGAVSPSYNTNCTYAGNITITSPAATAITFGSGAAGISTMNGSSATAQTINLTTGKTPIFTQFVMNNTGSGGVTLNTPIDVSTSLTMTSGLLNTTATNLLIMLNASTAPALTSTSTTYVNGPMQYQMAVAGTTRTLNFPIGTSPDCRPAALTVNHGASATQYNYTAQLFNANPWVAFNSGSPYIPTNMPHTVDTISGVHYWTINRTDNTGTSQPSANLAYSAGVYPLIQLNFGIDDDVLQGSSLTIVKNTSAAPAAWIDIGGTSALGNFSTPQVGSVTSTSSPTAFNSFSSFTLGSLNTGWNPLPIGLLSFTATPVNSVVDLNWSTKTEVNNHYFDIEKSKDGINFEFLQKVNSEALNGNSNVTLNYKAYDLKPFSGINYYRLKQTDYNGNYTYSEIVQVVFDTKSFVSVYPNPASDNIYVNVSSDYDNANLKFIDALGREVLSQTISSSNINSINTMSLAPGMYNVIINNGNGEVSNTKITIQK